MFRALAKAAGDGGAVFVRDLCRPEQGHEVDALVERYAAGESALARSLFHASLHAALTVDEVREAAEAGSPAGARALWAAKASRSWRMMRCFLV